MDQNNLETFRENEFGQIFFILATAPPTKLMINYENFAIHGYHFTTQSLRDLEQSRQSLNNGVDNFPAVSMWYQSIHSYLNAILQLTCLKTGGDFEKLYQYPIEEKYSYMLSKLTIVPSNFENILYEKLADYSRLEGTMKRDFINENEVLYSQANFSKRPMAINQTDVLQCMQIACEVFQRFRFVIAGLDLMPNISLMVSKNLVFDKLDNLYRSVVIPTFKDILSKQGLNVQLELNADIESYPVCRIFTENEVVIAAKVIEDDRYKRIDRPAVTNIMGNFFNHYSRKFMNNEQVFQRNYLVANFDPFAKAKI